MTYPANYYDADGNLKPNQQRQQERRQADATQRTADDILRRQVAEATAKPAPAWQEEYLRYAEERAAHAYRSGDKRQSQERLRIAKRVAKQHEAEQQEQQRIETLASNQQVKLAREHAEAFQKSPPPGSDPQAVALAVAFANSNEFDDPQILASEYWARVKSIEDDAFNRQQSERQRLEAETLKASAAVANAKVAELQTQQRRLHVEQQLGSNQ